MSDEVSHTQMSVKKAAINGLEESSQLPTRSCFLSDIALDQIQQLLQIAPNQGKHQFFLAGKVQVHGSLRNADTSSNLVNRHLVVAFFQQHFLGCLENQGFPL